MDNFGRLSEKKPYGYFLNTGEDTPLLPFLQRVLPENQALKWLIEFGAVYVDKKRESNADATVPARAAVRIHFEPKRYKVDREALRTRVVAETSDYLIVNKPSGIPMHPTLDNLYENLISGFDVPLYVTHRLDVPTSGLVVVAKTKEYQSLFNGVVAKRQIQKIYQATVEKPVALGLVTHYMLSSLKAPKIVVPMIPKNTIEKWEECRMNILSCTPDEGRFILEISLLTGRTHQVRAQLAALGAPIIGDEMYGGRSASIFGLQASALSFVCPKSHEKVEAKLSEHSA